MKKTKTVKNLLTAVMLSAAAVLCVCGISACADKPETEAVTIEQLVEANDRQNVIDEYGSLHVTETSTYDTGAVYTANVMFYANDYGVIMDYFDTKSDGSSVFACTFINGALYTYEYSGDSKRYSASLYDDGGYNDTVCSYYNLVPSEITKGPEVKDGKIVVEAVDGFAQLGYYETKTFYFNAETLLIEKMTSVFTLDTEYLTGSTYTESVYEYGCSDYVPALTAYNAHRNAEEKSNFIVVRNAGTSDESRIEYAICYGAKLYVVNSEEVDYALFADADCTIEVEDYKNYTQDGYVPVFYLAAKNLPTIKELLAANDAVTVVNKYGSLHVSYTYESEGIEYSVICHYSKNDYGMVYDTEWKSVDGDIYSSETVMNGVIYGYDSEDKTTEEPEGFYFNIVAADDYNKFFSDFYLNWMFGADIKGKVSLSDGKIVLAEYVEDNDKTVYYYFNADTLLLESYKDGDFEHGATYGGDYVPPRRAYNMHNNADDAKEITIIQYPGTDNEQRTTCTVSISSGVCLYYKNRDEYALYENVSCTNEIQDVTQYIKDNEYPTLYVGEKKAEAISFEYTYTQADLAEFTALLSDFEAAAMNGNESMASVQIAYDYMYDKFLYINAQSSIAMALYDLDNSDAKWNDYTSAYNAYLQAKNALDATRKNLYEADVAFKNVLLKGWTSEEINNLTNTEAENSPRITKLKLDNEEIVKAIRAMNFYGEDYLTEVSSKYEQLVANNQEIASLKGYENYYEYANKEIYFRDWSAEEIADFRAYVKKYMVPLYSQMNRRYTELKSKLTEEQLKQADIIVSNVRYSQLETDYVTMYFNSFGGTLSEHLNAMFDKKTALFAEGDTGSSTAYTDYISYYGEPFCVFGSGDYYQSVMTLIHEAGHYASAYNYSFIDSSYDVCETHSQSNEFLFLTFMKDYLDEEVYEYCVLYKIWNAINTIIETSIITEFEYTVYSAETPYKAEEYADIFASLYAEYNKSADSGNNLTKFLLYVAGTNSCYNISYGVSLVPVLDLFAKATDDFKEAQECYRIFMEKGDETYGFKGALALAGIGSPFDESTFLNIKETFDIDASKYSEAVQDALLAEESEIRHLVTLTAEDERVSWKDGKVLLLTFHKYPDSYVEGETSTTGSWYMWTVTDGEMIDWYSKNLYSTNIFADKLKQVLGMPISSTNTYISAVWVDVNDVIRPAYQPDPTKQLTAEDLGGSSLGIYKEWFNSNIISSYCSTWGQYPWTRLGYTYNWDADDGYGLSEFVILPGSEITVEFTKTLDEFVIWLYEQTTVNEANQAA